MSATLQETPLIIESSLNQILNIESKKWNSYNKRNKNLALADSYCTCDGPAEDAAEKQTFCLSQAQKW